MSKASNVTMEIQKKHGIPSRNYLTEQKIKGQLKKFYTIENTIMKMLILLLYSTIFS